MASSKFAKGVHAKAICDRSGKKYPYKEMVLEPGTKLLVHYTETDGKWNSVDHAQNYPPVKKTESVGLKNPRPDRVEPDIEEEI